MSNDEAKIPSHQRWLAAIEDYKSTGKISLSCQRHGVDRKKFMAMKDRYERLGLEGLTDRRHSKKPKYSEEDKEKIIVLALDEELSCQRVATDYELCLACKSVSASTVQRLLKAAGLATKEAKLRKLEYIYCNPEHHLYAQLFPKRGSIDQKIVSLEKMNPRLRMKDRRENRPGELVVHDVSFISSRDGIKYYANILIDSFSSFASARLQDSDTSGADLEFLRETSLPFFKATGISVSKVLTDLNPRYKTIPNSLHYPWRCSAARHFGFIEYFKREIRQNFMKKMLSNGPLPPLDQLNAEFEKWLYDYNHTENRGFPNFGKSPMAMIEEYLNTTGVDGRLHPADPIVVADFIDTPN